MRLVRVGCTGVLALVALGAGCAGGGGGGESGTQGPACGWEGQVCTCHDDGVLSEHEEPAGELDFCTAAEVGSESAGYAFCCRSETECSCEPSSCYINPSFCTCGTFASLYTGVTRNQCPSGFSRCCLNTDIGSCECDSMDLPCTPGSVEVEACDSVTAGPHCWEGVPVESCEPDS